MHTNIGVALKPNLMSFLLYSDLGGCISLNIHISITLRILNLHNKSPKIFAFDMFSLNCCLHPYIQC